MCRSRFRKAKRCGSTHALRTHIAFLNHPLGRPETEVVDASDPAAALHLFVTEKRRGFLGIPKWVRISSGADGDVVLSREEKAGYGVLVPGHIKVLEAIQAEHCPIRAETLPANDVHAIGCSEAVRSLSNMARRPPGTQEFPYWLKSIANQRAIVERSCACPSDPEELPKHHKHQDWFWIAKLAHSSLKFKSFDATAQSRVDKPLATDSNNKIITEPVELEVVSSTGREVRIDKIELRRKDKAAVTKNWNSRKGAKVRICNPEDQTRECSIPSHKFKH